MQIIIVLSLLFSILVAIFAVQNSEIVTVNFLWMKTSLSQAVVILGSALVGVLIMIPFDFFRTVKHKLKIREMSIEIKKLKEENSKIKNTDSLVPVKPESQAESVSPVEPVSNEEQKL